MALKEKEGTMKDYVSRAVVAYSPPLAAGAILRWNGRSGRLTDVEPSPFAELVSPLIIRANGLLDTVHRARSSWATGEVGLVPGSSPRLIVWEQEAARATFSLAPLLLANTGHAMPSGATGELVWTSWPEKTQSSTSALHPTLIVHTLSEAPQVERMLIVPHLEVSDPLLRHIALVLQVALEGKSEAEQLYAQSLTDALAVHFLQRYGAEEHGPRAVNGGLSPYKLQRTTVYIQDHLDQDLSLITLAAVAQTSLGHFKRLFKRATGLSPHQYVLQCRMEHARRLLTESDLPLVEIALQVGCADQSHFSALFLMHVTLTPKAYRDQTKKE